MSCYRTGGCGPYEMYSCNECPASKPEYLKRYKDGFKIFVAVVNGENKDNYMAIGFTKEQAIENCLIAFFKETGHTESELQGEYGCHIDVNQFDENKMSEVY